MKKIADGLQYNVYDLGNGRVLKKCKNKVEIRTKLLSWGDISLESGEEKVNEAITLGKNSLANISNKLLNIDPGIIGNPNIYPNLDYEQDKVVVIDEYINSHPLEANKLIVDKYIENIFKTWKYGFSDIVFNFTINNGIDTQGNVILIDLGELSFDFDTIAELIKKQKWLNQYSFTSLKDQELKQYLIEQMASNITLENLVKHWSYSQ